MSLIRLVTVHPALVHFTIGALPLIVLAYLLAAVRRSPRWTFVGDAALFVTTAITLLTTTFGVVSFVVVGWPGGLGAWPWLHLGFGAAATTLLIVLSIYRLRARRHEGHSGAFTLASSLVTGAAILVAGWIGGEVLVFRAGIAVSGAGDGALAPSVWRASAEPDDLLDAMGRLRAAWAGVQTELARMTVVHPSPAGFGAVGRDARELERVAKWMQHYGERTAVAGVGPMTASRRDDASAEFAHHVRTMSVELASRATVVREAAQGRDLDALALAVGDLSEECSHCHRELRWKHHTE